MIKHITVKLAERVGENDPWQTKWAKKALDLGYDLNLVHFRVPREEGQPSHVAVVYLDSGAGFVGMAHYNPKDRYNPKYQYSRHRGYMKACRRAFQAYVRRDSRSRFEVLTDPDDQTIARRHFVCEARSLCQAKLQQIQEREHE